MKQHPLEHRCKFKIDKIEYSKSWRIRTYYISKKLVFSVPLKINNTRLNRRLSTQNYFGLKVQFYLRRYNFRVHVFPRLSQVLINFAKLNTHEFLF